MKKRDMVAAGRLVDVDQSVASNTVKETHEEAGLPASPEKVIAVHDWESITATICPYGVIKIFVQCSVIRGFQENIETTEAAYFWQRTPFRSPLAGRKSDGGTRSGCALRHMRNSGWKTVLD